MPSVTVLILAIQISWDRYTLSQHLTSRKWCARQISACAWKLGVWSFYYQLKHNFNIVSLPIVCSEESFECLAVSSLTLVKLVVLVTGCILKLKPETPWFRALCYKKAQENQNIFKNYFIINILNSKSEI